MLCLGSIEMDRVIREGHFYKGIVEKLPFYGNFFYNFIVKIHDKIMLAPHHDHVIFESVL